MAFRAKARQSFPLVSRRALAKKWRHAGLGLLLVAMASSAVAQLPAPLKAGHPKLFLTQAGIDGLKRQLPYYPSAKFPAVKGSIQFSLLAKHKDSQDGGDQAIFGQYRGTNNTILVRHVDHLDTPGTISLQIMFIGKPTSPSTTTTMSSTVVHLKADAWTEIRVAWDAQLHAIDIKVNGLPVRAFWGKADAPFTDWTANEQIFDVGARRNEVMSNFILRDGQGQELMQHASLDTGLRKSWTDYRDAADIRLADIRSCATIAPTSSDYPKPCKVATGHRGTIYESAQLLSMAWLLTEQDKYKQGLLTYVDMLLASPLPAGNEWSMGGRVAAMGLVYDWLFDLMGSENVPAALGTGSYRSALAQRIKDTIAAENTAVVGDHLVASMCGSKQHLRDTSTVFDCEQKPIYEHWNRTDGPSVAQYYVSGHAFSAVTNMAVGLLAIAEEYPEVVPMIDTAYAHFDKGFMAARAAISADGGHQMGFAYGVSSIPERLLLWRTALDNSNGTPLLQADWQAQLLYPYIYGLRSDSLFPASGDNYDLRVGNPLLGQLSRGVASAGDDGVAWSFYREQVGKRTYWNDEILERLFWPAEVAAVPIASLPLARHFRVSGQVVMRDTWEYANATLLDFKSSSFAAQNHQHADQNSFALYYKAPLLLDTGLYDSYESVHWWNYYTRSVAHNTITVYDTADDQTERLMTGTSGLSRDGGQWMQALQQNYPTIDEIQPGGVNALDGIVRYENTPEYTYTSGNASKAYSATRLDRNNGFVRQVLFLRQPAFWSKPVTVIFDSVRSKRGLPATFLLHTAHDPAANTASTSNLGDGRYKLGYSAGQRRIATVRNGEGMLIVQTVLPENAVVHKVGGLDHDGTVCRQMSPVTANQSMPSSGDCRFMVRRRQADGSDLWFNHPPQKSEQKTTNEDVGVWRLEVTSPTALAVNGPEYFLHTLFVANNDGSTGTAQPPDTRRLAAAANTEALLLGSQLQVLFNRDVAPAARMDWTSPLAAGAILATGLKPGVHYALTSAAAGSAFARSLVETQEGTGTHLSSDQGVLSIE
ncbi:heparinase II/III family protein [Janthinobacterium sp. TB1-E2]|uniref:Heparinase II/III family protein n=1 Tax=Janthinobacterium aestuarii TaxID=2985511 RepID=A0ABZ2GG83_9BURK